MAETWIAHFTAARSQPGVEAEGGQVKKTPGIQLRWDVPARITMMQQALALPLFSLEMIDQPSEAAAL